MFVTKNRQFAAVSAIVVAAILECMLAGGLLAPASSLAAQQTEASEKKLKNRSLSWNPPKVDSPVRSVSPSPPCVLADVLEQAGERTNELLTNLQNFTAQEKISYQVSDRQGFSLDGGSEMFDYVVIFHQAAGEPAVEESRSPKHGSSLSDTAAQSRGLPELVLLFHPNLQDDYEMRCEGAAEWEGQRTWVVHFQQRPEKPGRTFSFRFNNTVYPARLKGNAWIAADSGEVVHLETALMEGIPPVRVHQWSLAIDYVPVQFRTRDVKIWLPEIANSYYDYGDHRAIVYHTFTDFLLFSIQTDQKIAKPKQP
jgi:hypothetical protein